MAISLFAGMESGHCHVCRKEDVGKELYSLLMSARDLYIEEVVNNKRMSAEMFADLFCASRKHIDCGRARCKNAHETNMRIVWHVLTAGEDFLKKYLSADIFTVSQCEEMVNSLLGSDAPPPYMGKKSVLKTPISFGCNFTDEQLNRIVAIADAFQLFCVSGDMKDALRSLFECKEGFCVKANNTTRVAVLFEALYANGLIKRGWQKTIEEGHFILSGKDGKPVTASYLSTILSKKRRTDCAISAQIRKAVEELKIMR